MSNSGLVSYTRLSPNHSGKRTHVIDRITPHCVVGQCSVETLGAVFAPTARQASSNYGIGSDGRIAMYCEEGNRSWCTSSNANDQRAVTIECASDIPDPQTLKPVVYQSLIALCVDICKRNGKKKLIWFGDKDRTLSYTPKSDEMIMTVHRWFAPTGCPGNWIYSHLGDLASQVTAKLSDAPAAVEPEMQYRVFVGESKDRDTIAAILKKTIDAGVDAIVKQKGDTYYVQVGAYKRKRYAEDYRDRLAYKGVASTIVESAEEYKSVKIEPKAESKPAPAPAPSPATSSLPYKVKVTAPVLNVRQKPSTAAKAVTQIRDMGVYTITAESAGQGAKLWGKLKSGAGWISLDYTRKVQ